MTGLRRISKLLVNPLRNEITWACQRGLLPFRTRKIMPWSWPLEPFTIYGDGWTCKWQGTDFDYVGRMIFWSGLRIWDKETVPAMLDEIRRARCFLDIGSNTGIYTVMGCAVNPNVRVIAIEPVPRVSAAIVRNVALNGFESRVKILNIAVGDTNGTVSFHAADNPTMGSLSVDGYRGQPGKVIEVTCKTLDSVVDELQIAPDFIKIDVEGFEHVVLSGANRVLSKFRPRMILELNPGDNIAAVAKILAEHRYELRHITDAGLQKRQEIVPQEAFRNWLCEPAS